MGKQSRRNRNRTGRDRPTPGYDADGVALPPGVAGSLFEVFKIDPWVANGGLFQFVVLPLDPIGNRLNEAYKEGNQERYRGFMSAALGARDYKKALAAVREHDRVASEGILTDRNEIDAHVRRVLEIRDEPTSLATMFRSTFGGCEQNVNELE
jgi:hypothetical protein